MKIRSMTATFGKLNRAHLELEEGFNLIEAPNEGGKSTWCAFWKAMLYGKGYLYYLTSGAIKNTLMLPVEVFLMWAVLNAAVNYGLDRKYIHKR